MTLVPIRPATLPAHLEVVAAKAKSFADAARATATTRAYSADWQQWQNWCDAHGFVALPASTSIVGLYLAAHADTLSVATLTRRLSTIASAHRVAGSTMDTKAAAIRDVMRGLRRTKGVAQRQAAAMTVPVLRAILSEACSADRLLDLRDRALFLIGMAGALRRSEIVALEVEDARTVPQGLRLIIRRSKGDQEGAGEHVQISLTGRDTCPVAALDAWLGAAGIAQGRIFRSVDRHGRIGASLSTRAVAMIVQRRAAMAGLDAKTFSGHSMRAGFATSAAAAGIEERDIARQTRHRSMAVLRRYIRDGELFRRNLAADIGL